MRGATQLPAIQPPDQPTPPLMLTSSLTAPTRHIVGLQALKNALTQAAELTQGLPEAALHWRPAPDEWTMHISHDATHLEQLRDLRQAWTTHYV